MHQNFLGQYAEAETIVPEAIASALKLRPDHPEPGWRYFVLAGALRKQNKSSGKLSEAEEARRKATRVLEALQAELADKPDLIVELQRYQAELLKTDKRP